MSNMKNSSVRRSDKKLKGFTLIELIIVIAIIGLLAAIVSLGITAFVRDSRFEAGNNNAKLVYTAVHNALIQSEIEQDISMFDAEHLSFDTSTRTAGDDLVYVELMLIFDNGSFAPGEQVEISSYYTSSTLTSCSYVFNANTVWDFSKNAPINTTDVSDKRTGEALRFYNNYIVNNLGKNFTGTCQIYIDLVNYTVDSVVYNEAIDNEITYLNQWYYSSGTAKQQKLNGFMGVRNIFSQRSIYKVKGEYFGCYPMLDDIGVLNVDYSCNTKNNTIETVT